jgi:ribose-phosphate pyrophosphokinase
VETLREPDSMLLPVVFLADAARDHGATRVGLVAPYLAYMRQDVRFRPGEAVTSKSFARLLSSTFDWLVTVDPHLHRYGSLGELYTIPTSVVHAASLIAVWVRDHIPDALLVGPDSESEQWVADVASRAGVPSIVLVKTRHGDRDVEVSVPDVERWRDRTPVLVDDIVSTARTMIATVRHLLRAGMRPPVCIGVHAVFAGSAYEDLVAAGAGRVVTCNTIRHGSNDIDISGALAAAVRDLDLL